MIHRVRFQGFKSLADVVVELEPFTVCIGANSSGKTSVLQGLYNALRTIPSGHRGEERPFESAFSGAHAPVRLATRPDAERLTIEVEGTFGTYGVEAAVREGPRVPRFRAWRSGFEGDIRVGKTSPRPQSLASFFQPLQAAGLSRVVFLSLNARIAAKPHYSDFENPRVEFDGEGLASVLQKLQGMRDGRFERIEAALARVVPHVLRLRTLPAIVNRTETQRIEIDRQVINATQSRERTGARVEIEFKGTGWVPLDLASEGTVLSLTLLTVLHDQAPQTILLDDLDKVLHPQAQGRVVAEVRRVMETAQSAIQIVTTTHSPYMIDHFEVDQVRVLRLDDESRSHCRRLSEHPKWKQRGGFMKPGEFWAGVGEDWVGD